MTRQIFQPEARAAALARFKSLALERLRKLRHPTRRGVILAVAVVPALFVAYVIVLIPFTPAISDIRKAKQEQPARVLSDDGRELAVFRRANRDWVKLSEVSPQVVAALVSTEDHRFYQHHGLDWRRTAGAALQTFSGDRQGGSTITQQLARNLYPDEIGRAPTMTRKLKEAITAVKIEALYTKDEILETYLNTVPFLYNAYGIEMAARTYFDKSADKLDVLESATLVGMLKGTSYYNPVINPERAVTRRNIVLAQMVKRERLDPARYEALKKRPLRIDFERQTEPNGPAPHFAQQLRKWLITWADRNDYNIYTDGLVIHTTIDARLQALANQAVARQTAQLQGLASAAWSPRTGWAPGSELVKAFVRESREYRAARDGGASDEQALRTLLGDAAFQRALREQKTMVQAGFLAVDPRGGEIRAWVGSRDFSKDAFDHVQQAQRQPGSTFKPFVYGAAFQQGMSPDDTLVDQAVEIALSGGELWRPTDGSPPSGKPISLRDGLAYSKNTITAQLIQKVGPANVAQLARAMGVRQSRLDVVPSLALGTSPVTLKEMVASYATIADGGNYREPVMVTRIENRDGKVLETFHTASPQRVLARPAAQTLRDVMRTVIDSGTAVGIRNQFGIRGDVAGKTGTTQDNADGWFILMHPELVAGAWVGFNDSRVTLRSDYWGEGAHSALPIVGDFYQRALRARAIDARARFVDEQDAGVLEPFARQVRSWFGGFFPSDDTPVKVNDGSARPARPAAAALAPRVEPEPSSQEVPASSRIDVDGNGNGPPDSVPDSTSNGTSNGTSNNTSAGETGEANASGSANHSQSAGIPAAQGTLAPTPGALPSELGNGASESTPPAAPDHAPQTP